MMKSAAWLNMYMRLLHEEGGLELNYCAEEKREILTLLGFVYI